MFSPKRVPISGAPEGLLLPYGPQDTDGKIVRLLSPSGGFEAIGITYLGGDRTLTCPVTSCSRLSQAGFGCNADVCSHEASDRRGDDESWLLAPPHRKFFRRSFCLPGGTGLPCPSRRGFLRRWNKPAFFRANLWRRSRTRRSPKSTPRRGRSNGPVLAFRSFPGLARSTRPRR